MEDAAPGFIGKLLQCGFELGAPFGGKVVAGSVEGESVLGQGGVDAVLPEGHRDDVTIVRCLAKVIRVRGRSRSSRTSAGGIQTEGSLPR